MNPRSVRSALGSYFALDVFLEKTGESKRSMTNRPLRIEVICVKDICQEAVHKLCNLQSDEVVPVTRSRALSLSMNPYADPDDAALLLAYADDVCVGYLSVVPCMLQTEEARTKVYFLSQWYVAPEYRDTGAGALLLMNGMRLKHDLVMTGLSRDAERVFRSGPFKEFRPLEYYMVFVDALNVLKFPFYAAQKWFERTGRTPDLLHRMARRSGSLIYSPIKRLTYTILDGCQRLFREAIVFDEVDSIDEAIDMARPSDFPQFHRGPEAINWMLSYPWYTENGHAAASGYFFGEHAALFRYIVVRINDKKNGSPLGFAVFSVSKRTARIVMKTLDFGFKEPQHRRHLLAAALYCARKYQADRLFLPKECGPFLRRLLFMRLLTFRRKRSCFCRILQRDSALADAIDQVELHLADGDCAFS